MGAWSYEVLTNDAALDLMGDLSCSKNIKADIYNILHDSNYNIHELLLAVEIVDISLNGIDENILGGLYEYENWFKALKNNPMENLKSDCIYAIKIIQEEEEKHGGWVKSVIEDRKKLLVKIENRLANSQ